jgi:Zn-dependent membrane protease YugP
MIVFDPVYFLFVGPALLLALWAQARVQMSFAEASRVPARLTGRAAARLVLDAAGLRDVPIEPVAGTMTDHYDPRHKVLRLSEGVYNQPSLAAVGIAAHEAGHAIQDASRYWPLVVRNLAVPIASTGSGLGMMVLMLGLILANGSPDSPLGQWLMTAGLLLFGGVVFFQVINLPVEFNASRRAKEQLASHGIVSPPEMAYVDKVLDSAAWTYVAATLQAIMVLLYFFMRTQGRRSQ